MKNFLFITVLIIAFLNAQSKDWTNINSGQPAPAEITLVSSQITQSTVQFSLNGFWKEIIETDKGSAWLISVDNGAPSITLGVPDMPIFAGSIIVPEMSHMKLNVISTQYVDFNDVLIAPSKGNLTRDIDPSGIPYTFGEQYEINGFYPGDIARINDPYIIRDLRGQAIHFQPFQYNPVTKVLRVYTDVIIEVVEDGISSVNVIDKPNLDSKMDNEFIKIYNRHFMNFNSASRYTPVGEYGNMLIICYADYMDEMEPFVEWKTMTGMTVEMVDVATIGNASAIKTFIANYYTDNGLTFVLLVGDAPQVPSSYSSGDSDVNYSYVVGNDHYPDLFVGRFSAQTEAQVITQVQRTIDYEKYPNEDETDWYTKCMSVASQEGPGDNGEYDYQHLRNISDNKLLPFTYDYVYEFFEGNQGGNDGPGWPTASEVGVAVDEGASIINYTGHGSTTSWGTSSFANSHVNQLTNTGKLPFIFSVACVNGNFVNSTCFAEAWLRAEDNGEPTGAIATIMSTINQSWNPPMRGQDEMNDILTEADENNIKRTFGGITMNGCMGMNDAYGSGGDEMTDTWTIFGDPSVVIRTAVPMDLTVTHEDVLMFGMTSFTIECDVDDAIAALSMDGALIGSAIIDGGSATIDFDPFETEGTVDIVVTAFNYKPYIASVAVIPDGVYAQFMTEDIDLCAGNSTVFIDQSSGTNTSWEWVFEGGIPDTYSGQVPPPVVYETTGVYDVSLTVSDGVETDTKIRTDYITVVNNVTAEFVADITIGTSPLTVNFTDLSSNDVDSWEWSFGNGGFSGLQNPTYSYYQAGEYTVSLTAGGNGCESTETKIDFIVVEVAAPISEFSAEPTSGEVPLTVNFSDESTGEVDSWLWDFGDGNTSDEQFPEYIYEESGIYSVSLAVTGPGGSETMIKNDLIEVREVLMADFTSEIQNVYDEPDVNFYSNSVGNITAYEWTFEGGEPTTSMEENPIVSYYIPGVYDVSLTVMDGAYDNTITKEDYITVHYWVGTPDNLLNETAVKAYPNPFSNKVSIELNLVQSAEVTIEIFDITGRVLQKLTDKELSSGKHIFNWDANTIEPGLYFYTVRSGSDAFTRKLVLSR